MSIVTIKDREFDFQAKVDEDGNLYVKPSGGGGLNNVNIFDSAGNPLNSTGGALDVNSGGIGWANFGQSTPSQVNVGLTSTILLNANPNRLYASFMNNSSQTIYIQYKINAVWQQGFVIRPNAMRDITTIELFLGQVNAITQGSSAMIDVIEGVL